MNEEISNSLYELIDLIDNSSVVKDIKRLKESINKDKALMQKIKAFSRDKDKLDKYELIARRQELYQNPLIKEYQTKINELNILIRQINNAFGPISPNLACKKDIF